MTGTQASLTMSVNNRIRSGPVNAGQAAFSAWSSSVSAGIGCSGRPAGLMRMMSRTGAGCASTDSGLFSNAVSSSGGRQCTVEPAGSSRSPSTEFRRRGPQSKIKRCRPPGGLSGGSLGRDTTVLVDMDEVIAYYLEALDAALLAADPGYPLLAYEAREHYNHSAAPDSTRLPWRRA